MSQYEKSLRKATAIEETPTQEESIILRALSTPNQGGGGGKRYKHSDTSRSPTEQK